MEQHTHCTEAELYKLSNVTDAYAGKLFPQQQIQTFSNMRYAFPCRKIRAPKICKPLPYSLIDLSEFRFQSKGLSLDIYDYVSRNRVTGLLIMKSGCVCFEHYDFGLNENHHWMSMSMAKSISTTLVGIAIQQGDINNLDDDLATYLPKLKGSSYERVTIRQLLLMTSGVQWNEDHTNPLSERRDVLALQNSQKPGAICEYMGNLPQLHDPGTHWNYSTGETHLVGELLYAATRTYLADYLTEHLWQPLGMEHDAYWWLESSKGLEIAGTGINACLRDYARFGNFMANGGIIDGKNVLPESWCQLAAGPTKIGSQIIPYGFMWWPVPNTKGHYDTGAYSARGIFGQRIYVNPSKNLVIVTTAARSKPMYDDYIRDNDFFNAIAGMLEEK